ncbi:hypothetical protein WA158_000278 [Blastocystis sp. Blastoise]
MASQQKQAEQQQQQEEAKKNILHTIMDFDARARLGRISVVDPAKATAIENKIVDLAQKGQIREVKEKDIIAILENMDGQVKHTKVIIKRNTNNDDDDMDDDFFDV